MAELVAAMAMTHSPGLTGWFTRASAEYQQLALQATAEMRRRLEAARPDVLVMFSNDHLLNWPINNVPEYTVGHRRGARRSRRLVRRVARHGEVPRARARAAGALASSTRARAAGWRSPTCATMQFDDGISVPTHYLNPDARFRLVPVTMNCTVPPIPDAGARLPGRHAHARRRSRAYPGDERIAVSPPAGSRTSRAGRATSGWTRSSTGGSSICSSTATTRPCCASARSSAWRPRARAAPPSCSRGCSSSRSPRGPADVLAYMPAVAWRSGTGMVVWNDLA